MAIRIKAKLATSTYDPGVSRFLGSPVLPEEYLNMFDDTVLFLLQINLEEIAEFDPENVLPHKGYLYFFLDTAEGEYNLKPIVKYYPGYPENVVDDFNSVVPGYEDYVDEYLIEFSKCDDYETGNKLLGKPNDWNYQDEPKKLLFQFDPLDSDMQLFDYMDGLFYFFFEGKTDEFDKISLKEEIS